jgi:hypothetical protein
MIEGFSKGSEGKGGNVQVDARKDGRAIFWDGVVGVGDRSIEAR